MTVSSFNQNNSQREHDQYRLRYGAVNNFKHTKARIYQSNRLQPASSHSLLTSNALNQHQSQDSRDLRPYQSSVVTSESHNLESPNQSNYSNSQISTNHSYIIVDDENTNHPPHLFGPQPHRMGAAPDQLSLESDFEIVCKS